MCDAALDRTLNIVYFNMPEHILTFKIQRSFIPVIRSKAPKMFLLNENLIFWAVFTKVAELKV